MKHFNFYKKTKDGLKLYFQGWQPDANPRAVICLVHGLGEHSGRYLQLGEFLTQAGYAVSSFDLRGHGRSEGKRGHASSYEDMMKDISLFIQETKERFSDKPIFLYGHSLGGNLVINYVLRYPQTFKGVIATGAAFKPAIQPPTWKIMLGKMMRCLWPSLLLNNELDIKFLSRDNKVIEDYRNDPLVHSRISARFGIDFLAAGLWALESAKEFYLPLLLMHGSADQLTSVEACQEFARQVKGNCTLKIWNGFFHEIHNEAEKNEVFHFLLQWIKSKA